MLLVLIGNIFSILCLRTCTNWVCPPPSNNHSQMTSRYPFTRIAIEIKHKSGNICLKRPVMSYQGLHITSGFKCRWGCHLVDFFLTKIKITFINPSTAIFMKMREKQPSIYQQRTFKKKNISYLFYYWYWTSACQKWSMGIYKESKDTEASGIYKN